jgi:hypothetical protein
VEARIAAMRTQMPLLKVCRFETNWLNNVGRVYALFDELGLEYDKLLLAAKVGIREHDKEEEKTGPAMARGRGAQMLSQFRELLSHRGLELLPEWAAVR